MKQVFRFCLVVLLVVSIVPMNVLAAPNEEGGIGDYDLNLIDNGAFDAIPELPGSIGAWDTWLSEDETEIAASPDLSTNTVLKIHTDDIPVKWGVSEAHQWIDNVVPGQLFKFTADVFFESAENSLVTMRIDFFDDTLDKSNPNLEEAYITHIYKDFFEVNDGFEKAEITGTVPKGTRYVKVEFDIKAYEANAKGTAYFDNALLVYQWAPTNLRTTNRTETSITMEWDKPLYGDGYAYEVYRLTEAGEVALAETENTSFTWTDANPPTSPIDAVAAYSFYVKAKLDAAISWPSNKLRAATQKPANAVTIMPLGDSLTEGYTSGVPSPGGYRGALWELLQSSHPNALFVGSLRENPSSVANFDPDHEGHPGHRAIQIAELVDSQIAAYVPDYVLLMSGTNDMWDSDNEAAFYMKVTLENIADSLPDTYVIVSSIPDIYLNDPPLRARIVQYNNELAETVAALKAAGKKIGFIDINAMLKESYFTYPDSDYFHPDASGYNVMAEVWHDALDAAIDTGDVSGRFPSNPVLNDPVLIADNTAIQLTWQEAYDNVGVDRYKIFMNDEEKMSVTGSTYGIVSNLAPSMVYSFSVAAVDKAGNETVSNKVSIATPAVSDDTPPTPPSDLRETGVSYNGVTLSWLPGTDDVGIGEYMIRYGGSSASVTDIVYGTDRMKAEVTGLLPETRYDFDVFSIDLSGNESETSAAISVETLAAPPSDLRVSEKTTTSATLSWNAATDKDGVLAYRIYKDGSRIAETDQTSFAIEALTPGQTYKFEVTAVDRNDIETLRSAELTVRMELRAPIGLAMTANTVHSIDIRWSPVSGASGYDVYMNGTRVATTTEPTYRAGGLKPDTSYSFAVQSLFGEGLTSELSVTVEMKTEKLPPAPMFGGGGGGGGAPLADRNTKYETTDKGIKLTHSPNELESLRSLNGSDARWAIDIPSGKPFDLLELRLDGVLLKLAADKKKPVVVRMGSLVLELTPGWLNVADKDKVTFTIVKKSLEGNQASIRQALRPLSDAYDFTVQRNGAEAAEFIKPVRLSLSTKEKPDSDLTGIYVWDDTNGVWNDLGGTVDADGNVALELSRFSEYAVFAKVKTFADIANHWARKEIESLAARQIVSGVTSDRFHPSGEVTRAEFAAMLARAFHLKPPAERPPFDDLKEGSWYFDSISAAYEAGWIQGVGGGRFAPANRITREEMAVMIWKAYASAKAGAAGQNDPAGKLPFVDAAEISEWALGSVSNATAQGLIYGMNGSFKPDLYADRAQAAVMISRLLDQTDKR
ncbi:fibronectin type III domain-containing protein [Cohnella panacarvi]|uniref:fibronectin type III domain-containing protein n=1 Tax=Cohnella panacarvi TaxID=400776 RepID=UPI00047D48C2|nr:S-layer homology domain-containing protein [Cohnella panacarvi]